jgi:hypothetical protein
MKGKSLFLMDSLTKSSFEDVILISPGKIRVSFARKEETFNVIRNAICLGVIRWAMVVNEINFESQKFTIDGVHEVMSVPIVRDIPETTCFVNIPSYLKAQHDNILQSMRVKVVEGINFTIKSKFFVRGHICYIINPMGRIISSSELSQGFGEDLIIYNMKWIQNIPPVIQENAPSLSETTQQQVVSEQVNQDHPHVTEGCIEVQDNDDNYERQEVECITPPRSPRRLRELEESHTFIETRSGRKIAKK